MAGMDLQERMSTVMKLRLCFGCLKPTGRNHYAKVCKRKNKCDTCGQDHPTLLHEYHEESVKVSSVRTQSSGITLSIVPVILSHKSNPNVEFCVYATC